jgi:thiamine pyrophosphokinase
MRAIIVAGGRADAKEGWQHWVKEGDRIIGADGGAAQALAWGIVPDTVIGDMDSLSVKEQATLAERGCRFIEHPRAKDETDLELALRYASQQGAQEIVILGALGGRLDHTLSNVLLMTLPSLEGVSVRIADGGEAVTLQGGVGDLVSLLPLGGDVRGVTTRGLAWPLERDTLHFGFSRGVSNEMTARVAQIEVAEGFLLVIHGPAPEH